MRKGHTMNLIKSAWGIVRENWRPYLVINIAYYGLVAACMIYVAFDRPLQDMLLKDIGQAFMTGPLSFVGKAYVNAEVLKAIAVTFLVNLLVGSFVDITLPSLIIPFSGLLMGIVRAVLWGLLLSPAHPDLRLAMIPHSLTLVIEGQAYVLALLAVYIHGRALFQPQSVGVEGHWKGYFEGLKRTAKIYLLVVITLAVAAIYEVLEVVIMARLFA
jgi:hypothetical protein